MTPLLFPHHRQWPIFDRPFDQQQGSDLHMEVMFPFSILYLMYFAIKYGQNMFRTFRLHPLIGATRRFTVAAKEPED